MTAPPHECVAAEPTDRTFRLVAHGVDANTSDPGAREWDTVCGAQLLDFSTAIRGPAVAAAPLRRGKRSAIQGADEDQPDKRRQGERFTGAQTRGIRRAPP